LREGEIEIMRASTRSLLACLLGCLGCLVCLVWLPGCAQSRCSGAACADRAADDAQAVKPIRSQHYRVALRVGALEGRELTSAHYRLRAMAGAVQLEARP
jgi:hypothetical protein